MTPYYQALALYADHPELCLADDLLTHSRVGFQACTPQVFAMLRPVRKDWPAEWFQDIERVEPLETADCWLVWLLCGDFATACQWLPKMLPWLGFSRRHGPVRFVRTERLLKSCSRRG